jgi:uncharacterized membrane protein YhhN
MIGAAILLCVLACTALLVSERRGSRVGVWLFKPLAAACFVTVGLLCDPFESSYGRWILAGLVLSALGDVLLIPNERELVFLAGMLSFLLGHVAYCIAFLGLGVDLAGLAASAIVVLPFMAIVSRWLWPHLEGIFRYATPSYVIVISAMVLLAGSASFVSGNAALVVGAWMFAISDVSVARERFVTPGFVNGAWGLPLYFGAQIVLALTVAGVRGDLL